MAKNKKIYYFPDLLLENTFGKTCGAEKIDVIYFKEHPNEFKDSLFFIRGITNNKYCQVIRKLGCDYFYIDTGYFGNLNNYYQDKDLYSLGKKLFHRVVLNNMQLFELKKMNKERYYENLKYIKSSYGADESVFLKPWKKSGSRILICPPSYKVGQVFHFNIDQWIEETISQIKKYSDREIIVRKKPLSRAERTEANTIQETLDQDIFILVTFNSIAATDAILHGIPALTLGLNAATPVSINKIKNIEYPIYPNRELWLNNLAYQQYHIDELESGVAWKYLKTTFLKNKE